MLSTLDRMLLRRLVLRTASIGLSLCFVFFVASSYRLLKVEGLSLMQVVYAVPLALPFLLPYLLPISYVIALTLVYGRLVADGEALALSALGISRLDQAWAALLLGLGLSFLSLVLTTTVVPFAYRKRQDVYHDTYLKLAEAGGGENLSIVMAKDGLAVFVKRYGPEGLEGIVIRRSNSATHSALGKGSPVKGSLMVVAARGKVSRAEGGQTQLNLEDVVLSYYEGEPLLPSRDERPDAPPAAPTRLLLNRISISVGSLGGRKRLKASAFSSAELRRQVHVADTEGPLGNDREAFIAKQTSWGGRRELAERAATAGAGFFLTLLIVPLVFALDSRAPLVPFAAGLAGSAGLFFVVQLVGTFAAERLHQTWPVYAGWVTSGGVGAWLSYRSRWL